MEREGLLPIVHELLERMEAHLVADQFYRVTCNVRTEDPEEFAASMHEKGLGGLEGPTISKVCSMCNCLAVALLPYRGSDLFCAWW